MMYRDRCPNRLVSFLRDELAITEAAIAVALKHQVHSTDPIPMILWQYGLVSLEQLERIFDWLTDQSSEHSLQWRLDHVSPTSDQTAELTSRWSS